MKNFFLLSFLIILLANINTSYAEQVGASLGRDNRVQVFDYDPNDVYLINARIGYSTLIQLENGEEITDSGGLGMGDALSWSLAVRGNNIFFKPIAEMADTNLVLVTNKRSYAFELSTMGGETTYIARFNYPEELVEKSNENGIAKPSELPDYLYLIAKDELGNDLLVDTNINTYYSYRGSQSIKPTNVWDNSRFTYLRFNHAGDLPTVYRVLADGSEAVVNTNTEKDTLILHEVGALYRLRFGAEVGEIANEQNKLPKFNTIGTGDENFVRITN